MSVDDAFPYVVVIELNEVSLEDYRKLLIFLDNAKFVEDWHSPFQGFIMILSQSGAREVGELIDAYLGGARFSVSRVSGMSNIGRLSNDTWTWMDKSGYREPKVDKDADA